MHMGIEGVQKLRYQSVSVAILRRRGGVGRECAMLGGSIGRCDEGFGNTEGVACFIEKTDVLSIGENTRGDGIPGLFCS